MTVTQAELDTFCRILEDNAAEHYKRHYDRLTPPTFSAMPGRKYRRIVSETPGQGRSAVVFVELATGDLWKPAGWKGPERNFPRGNIRDAKPSAWITPSGCCLSTRRSLAGGTCA